MSVPSGRWVAAVALLVLGPAVARAELAEGLARPPSAGATTPAPTGRGRGAAEVEPLRGPAARLGAPPAPGAPGLRARLPRVRPADGDGGEERPSDGPRVAVGYGYYVLADGHGGGAVHEGNFGGFLPFGRLRVGVNAALGTRDYRLGQDDLVARATVTAGYQHLAGLGPFVPYAVVAVTGGVAFEKRFHTPLTELLAGGGLELGAELRLVRRLHVGVGVGWLHVALGTTTQHVGLVQVRLGL